MTRALTLSNLLSLSRAGLAFAFLLESPIVRLCAIILAMISDFLDGFIARRMGTTTQLGAILDPVMDKFFVLFAGCVFFFEGRLVPWELIALMSRDISLLFFGLYLSVVKGWKGYECQAILWGKITTVAQFFILIGLTLNFVIPAYVYWIFVVMAAFAFIELITSFRRRS